MPHPLLTILTGDIVASARLDPKALDGVMAALADACSAMRVWKNGTHSSVFERFRGDGWQAAAPHPALALRAALFLRATVRSLGRDMDTRISVGIGPGELAPGASLAATSGPAFELSGRGLDDLDRAARFAIGRADQDPALTAWQAVFSLADELSRRWTVRQAEVFRRMLPPGAGPQGVVASELGISQQMVAKHLAAGGDWALRRALRAMEGEA